MELENENLNKKKREKKVKGEGKMPVFTYCFFCCVFFIVRKKKI
jgi:uncharacterized protein YutD